MISGVLLDPKTGRPIVDRDVRAQLEARGWVDVVENLERSRRRFLALERNPPLFMDVSSAYSGDELGLPYRDIMGEGIVAPTDLAVTGQAGANSVNIAKGACWVVGDTNTDLQPTYRMFNDAIVNLGVSPDPALARRVHVIGQVTDQGFAGSGRVWALQALHGTPNAAPVLPALPASAVSLANILVPAAAATSAAYTITDTRARAQVGAGGALGPTSDMVKIAETILGADAASIVFSSIPQTYRHLKLVFDGQIAGNGATAIAIRMRLNNLATLLYDGHYEETQAATYMGAEYGSLSSFVISGNVYGTGNNATARVAGAWMIHDYAAAHFKMLTGVCAGDWSGGTTGAGGRRVGTVQGLHRVAAATDRVEFLPEINNVKAGSVLSLYGLK